MKLYIERATRIELVSLAWEANVLPLYYARTTNPANLISLLAIVSMICVVVQVARATPTRDRRHKPLFRPVFYNSTEGAPAALGILGFDDSRNWLQVRRCAARLLAPAL